MSKFGTFFKTDDKDSKITTFAQRSSKFFSAIIDSKDVCKVCGCSFKLISANKFTCSCCSEPVCKEHSSETIGEDIQRICDLCRDEKIREETESKIQDTKDKLFQDIRGLQEERVSKTREISKLGSKIRKVENEYKENILKYNLEEEELKEVLATQKLIAEEIEKEVREMKTKLEVSQISEGKASIKLKNVNESLQDFKIEVEAIESENLDQKSTLDDLKTSAQQKVQIKMVKETLCKLCLMKVSLTHAVMLKNVLPIAEEKKTHQNDLTRNTCRCSIS